MIDWLIDWLIVIWYSMIFLTKTKNLLRVYLIICYLHNETCQMFCYVCRYDSLTISDIHYNFHWPCPMRIRRFKPNPSGEHSNLMCIVHYPCNNSEPIKRITDHAFGVIKQAAAVRQRQIDPQHRLDHICCDLPAVLITFGSSHTLPIRTFLQLSDSTGNQLLTVLYTLSGVKTT